MRLAGGRDGFRLPMARWGGEGSLDVAAAALGREILQRKASWTVQVSARAVHEHPLRARLSVTYLVATTEPTAANERAAWYTAAKARKLVSPCHRESIAHALAFASNHADRWVLAFALLPSAFTLTQLQRAHEVLLGRRLYKASFRRVVNAAERITPTSEWRAEGRGRPAQLYRRAPNATR